MSNVNVSISCSSSLAILPLYHIIPRYLITLTRIFSNILLLVGIIMDPLKCFRNSSSYLIINLAAMDILTCSTALLRWLSCAVRNELYPFHNLPIYISASSIFTMACDRYMSCVHPFKCRVLITRKVTLTVILLQWSLCGGHISRSTSGQCGIVLTDCYCCFCIDRLGNIIRPVCMCFES